MCEHTPKCPAANATDHGAARVVVAHPEQGWSLLCNGVIAFDDGGELAPARAFTRIPLQRSRRRAGVAA
jgi:Family of unknown function (DUF5999)